MHEGVYLLRDGTFLANDSAIYISDIGNPDSVYTRLQCVTDRMSCCTTNPTGEWFFPNTQEAVPVQNSATTFFRNRGDNGTVNLNRVNSDVMMPTGRFCCVIPDAIGVNQIACVVVCKSIIFLI